MIFNSVPAAGDPPLSAESLIDDTPVGTGQYALFVLCCCVSMVEGFDLQAMAFAAPDIAQEWHVASALFGLVFSAGLFGGLAGGFLVGAVGFSFGPKTTLVFSLLLFGTFTTTTVFGTTLGQLGILRCIAGIGLGAAVPGVVSIVASYFPRRVRSLAVTLVVSCQLLGAVVGGAISASLVNAHGWRAIFVLGGVTPLFLVPLLAWWLPESLGYLDRQRNGAERIRGILVRFGKVARESASRITVRRNESHKAAVVELLNCGRAFPTLLLWTTCIVGAALLYFLVNWLPSILRNAGASQSLSIIGSVVLNAGGLSGAIVLSRLMDKVSSFIPIIAGYAISAFFILIVSRDASVTPLELTMIYLVGFFGLGAQSCITALIVKLYPHDLHSAGVGCALGFARIGAVLGPLVGSYILEAGGSARDLFYFAALAAICAALSTLSMSRSNAVRA